MSPGQPSSSSGIAIGLGILMGPALVRAAYVAERDRRAGVPLTVRETFGNLATSFIAALILTAIVALAVGLALFLICLANPMRFFRF